MMYLSLILRVIGCLKEVKIAINLYFFMLNVRKAYPDSNLKRIWPDPQHWFISLIHKDQCWRIFCTVVGGNISNTKTGVCFVYTERMGGFDYINRYIYSYMEHTFRMQCNCNIIYFTLDRNNSLLMLLYTVCHQPFSCRINLLYVPFCSVIDKYQGVCLWRTYYPDPGDPKRPDPVGFWSGSPTLVKIQSFCAANNCLPL